MFKMKVKMKAEMKAEMKAILNRLSAIAGEYEGEGINHETQPFVGRLSLQPILDKRGFLIQFSATGTDGTIFHKEESTIAPSIHEKLVLWNFNTNTPGLVAHELKDIESPAGIIQSLIFAFSQITDVNTFREEIALKILNDTSISYGYSWGLPGGEFKERSSVCMNRKKTHSMKVDAHLIFYVKDQIRSAKFYSAVLGLSPTLDVPGMTEFFLNDGCIFGLMPENGIKRLLGEKLPDPSNGSGIPRAELYLRVDDPSEFHQRAIKNGANELSPVAQRNWGDVAGYCMDFDGHVVVFASKK